MEGKTEFVQVFGCIKYVTFTLMVSSILFITSQVEHTTVLTMKTSRLNETLTIRIANGTLYMLL